MWIPRSTNCLVQRKNLINRREKAIIFDRPINRSLTALRNKFNFMLFLSFYHISKNLYFFVYQRIYIKIHILYLSDFPNKLLL